MKPPALARALVRLFTSPEDRAFLLHDLSERFREEAESRGVRSARRWYWSQALSVVSWALRPDGGLLWRRRWVGLPSDLRHGIRTLARRPVYAAGVSGTLGLGLAAALIAFATAWNVWLAPMPYPDPEQVVRLYEIEPLDAGDGSDPSDAESGRHLLSPTLLEDFRDQAWVTIQSVSAVSRGTLFDWGRDGRTQKISGAALSPNGFGVFGIAPTLGRLPTESERDVLLSERFWQTAFGADPGVVGSTLDLGWGPLPVVGVAPLPSGYPGDADIVTAIDFGDTEDRGFRHVEAVARLRTGHTISEASAELNAFVAALAEIHPEHRGWSVEAVVLADDLTRPFRGVLALLLAASATFLLLACVNVMGLVAARRVVTRRDRSIRLALGASERRLLRGSLTESVILPASGPCWAHWERIGSSGKSAP